MPDRHSIPVSYPPRPFLHHMEKVIRGDFPPRQEMPMWTRYQHEVEDDEIVRTKVLQDFDEIISDCDLSLLSVFLRKDEGQSVSDYLQESFHRVTLAEPASIYALYDKDTSILCFSEESVAFARRAVEYYTCERPTEDETLIKLAENVYEMAHLICTAAAVTYEY